MTVKVLGDVARPLVCVGVLDVDGVGADFDVGVVLQPFVVNGENPQTEIVVGGKIGQGEVDKEGGGGSTAQMQAAIAQPKENV